MSTKKSSVEIPAYLQEEAYVPPIIVTNYMPSNRASDLYFLDADGKPELSLAKQSMADECDINNIMAQYEKTGLINFNNTIQGQYLDLPDSITYHEAQNAVLAAQAAFDLLPAQIRAKFHNDPAAFLDWSQNPSNLDELRDLGLMPPADASETEPTQREGGEASEPLKGAKKPQKQPSSDD